jgi:hypothetical protein
MSNYAASVLVTGQSLATAKFNAPEERRQMPTVMELALRNQHISIPDAQALRVSPLRPVDVNYLKYVAPGSGTTKAYNHTGGYGDSAKVNVTYVQLVETFSLPRKIAANNFLTYENMFVDLWGQKWKNLRTRHDNAALQYAYNYRNQLSAATMDSRLATAGMTGWWDETNDALVVPSGYSSTFIAQLKAAMYASYYEGDYDVICDVKMATLFENYMNQGTGNFSNLSYQFSGCNFTRTQQQIDANFNNGVTLALPAGQFAGLNWNEQLNVKGVRQDEGGYVGILTTAEDPFGSGAIADLSVYTQRADTTTDTTGGSPEDIVDQFELTLTVGYVLPPLSTSNDSVCMEIVQAPVTP